MKNWKNPLLNLIGIVTLLLYIFISGIVVVFNFSSTYLNEWRDDGLFRFRGEIIQKCGDSKTGQWIVLNENTFNKKILTNDEFISCLRQQI